MSKTMQPRSLLLMSLALAAASRRAAADVPLKPEGTAMGISQKYIGSCYGYDADGFRDLGLNTAFFGSSIETFEPENDSSKYGSPSPSDIAQNIDAIPWDKWDKTMGSASWRSTWDKTKADHVRVMIGLRNQYRQKNWSPNPMKSTEDWNEWYEHVFALGYWLNVRNHYQVDDYEVLNEPNCPGLDFPCEGFLGTEADYLNTVKHTHDALDALYKKYLPGRTYNVTGPAVSYPEAGGDPKTFDTQGYTLNGHWITDTLTVTGDQIGSVAFHDYGDAAKLISQSKIPLVHYAAESSGHKDIPIWLTEWGGKSDPASYANGVDIVSSLIYMSVKETYITGSHYYVWGSLYDSAPKSHYYYALRIATRALQGGKVTYRTSSGNGDINAITTKGKTGTLYVLATNKGGSEQTLTIDLSDLHPSTNSTSLYRYDDGHDDTKSDGPTLSNGRASVQVPGSGAVLLQVGPGGDPTDGYESPQADAGGQGGGVGSDASAETSVLPGGGGASGGSGGAGGSTSAGSGGGAGRGGGSSLGSGGGSSRSADAGLEAARSGDKADSEDTSSGCTMAWAQSRGAGPSGLESRGARGWLWGAGAVAAAALTGRRRRSSAHQGPKRGRP